MRFYRLILYVYVFIESLRFLQAAIEIGYTRMIISSSITLLMIIVAAILDYYVDCKGGTEK